MHNNPFARPKRGLKSPRDGPSEIFAALFTCSNHGNVLCRSSQDNNHSRRALKHTDGVLDIMKINWSASFTTNQKFSDPYIGSHPCANNDSKTFKKIEATILPKS